MHEQIQPLQFKFVHITPCSMWNVQTYLMLPYFFLSILTEFWIFKNDIRKIHFFQFCYPFNPSIGPYHGCHCSLLLQSLLPHALPYAPSTTTAPNSLLPLMYLPSPRTAVLQREKGRDGVEDEKRERKRSERCGQNSLLTL